VFPAVVLKCHFSLAEESTSSTAVPRYLQHYTTAVVDVVLPDLLLDFGRSFMAADSSSPSTSLDSGTFRGVHFTKRKKPCGYVRRCRGVVGHWRMENVKARRVIPITISSFCILRRAGYSGSQRSRSFCFSSYFSGYQRTKNRRPAAPAEWQLERIVIVKLGT
jgi:hypothetical protein